MSRNFFFSIFSVRDFVYLVCCSIVNTDFNPTSRINTSKYYLAENLPKNLNLHIFNKLKILSKNIFFSLYFITKNLLF